MSRPNYIKGIRNRILEAEAGSVFIAADFNDIADKTTISIDLNRIEAEGIIKRVIRGIYYKPKYSELLKKYSYAYIDDIAKAIARNYGWTIVPYGDTALNMLGLDTQVPAVYLYVSDGPYKEYNYDGIPIKFKRTTNRNITKFSYKTALTIQALKALGKERVTDKTISHL